MTDMELKTVYDIDEFKKLSKDNGFAIQFKPVYLQGAIWRNRQLNLTENENHPVFVELDFLALIWLPKSSSETIEDQREELKLEKENKLVKNIQRKKSKWKKKTIVMVELTKKCVHLVLFNH